MSSYATPEDLQANYEALRVEQGLSWAEFVPEIHKMVAADSPLGRWAAAQARAESEPADAEPKGRKASVPSEKG